MRKEEKRGGAKKTPGNQKHQDTKRTKRTAKWLSYIGVREVAGREGKLRDWRV